MDTYDKLPIHIDSAKLRRTLDALLCVQKRPNSSGPDVRAIEIEGGYWRASDGARAIRIPEHALLGHKVAIAADGVARLAKMLTPKVCRDFPLVRISVGSPVADRIEVTAEIGDRTWVAQGRETTPLSHSDRKIFDHGERKGSRTAFGVDAHMMESSIIALRKLTPKKRDLPSPVSVDTSGGVYDPVIFTHRQTGAQVAVMPCLMPGER